MKKGSKKKTAQIYKGADYQPGANGIEQVIPGSKEYYSAQDLTTEAKQILEDFGFKLADLMNIYLERHEYDTQTFGDTFGRSNIYRYFSQSESAIIPPTERLLDLPKYMMRLGKKRLPSQEQKAFFSRINILSEKIGRYCMEDSVFDETMTSYLKKQSNEVLLRFLKSIYVLQLSEETWCYWLCYSILNFEKQEEAKCILAGCTGLLPNYNKLFSIYFHNRESDIAHQHLILTAEEKYSADAKKLKEVLVKIALEYFKQCWDKEAVVRRVWDIMHFDIQLSPADWSVLLTYENLCDKRELPRAIDFVLSNITVKNNLQKDCALELVKYFERRFRHKVEEREENELVQFLSRNEETK